MQDASLLVMPSKWYEGLPMTIVEAFATGLPVVASGIGSLAELVRDGQTGRLCRPGDPQRTGRCARFHDDGAWRTGGNGR